MSKKDIEKQIRDDFENEMKENDKKINEENKIKSEAERTREFVMFIKENNCKIRGGGKYGE